MKPAGGVVRMTQRGSLRMYRERLYYPWNGVVPDTGAPLLEIFTVVASTRMCALLPNFIIALRLIKASHADSVRLK